MAKLNGKDVIFSPVVHKVSDYVSYAEEQNLTEEQKATARGNINAVDASLVTDNLNSSEKIPNGIGLSNYLSDNLHNFDVVAYNSQQRHNDKQRQTARNNIDVDGGKWEKLFTIEGDGETVKWEYTQTPDGATLKLSAVAITVTQTVAETANAYGQLYGYYNDTYVNVTTINKILTTGVLNGQATAVIQPNKGYYEAYAVDMTKGNPANMSYSGFRQFMASTDDLPYINKIKIVIQNTVKMSAGNTIDVWGVKYYE